MRKGQGDGLSFLPKGSIWNSEKDQGTDSLYDRQVGIPYRPKGERSIYLLDVLRVNGDSGPLPPSDVAMQREARYDVLEVKGGPLGEPVRFLPELAPAGDPKRWKLDVRNAKGEVVRTLSGEGAPPGVIPWDGGRSMSARRVCGVARSETIYLGLAVSAFRFDSAELSPHARAALKEGGC